MDKRAIARQIAEESIVLLKNDGQLLPLASGKRAAFFGRTQLDTIFSGNGSGATATKDRRCILTACEEAGLSAVPSLKAWYEEQFQDELTQPKPGIDWGNAWNLVHSGAMYELFGKYQPPTPEYLPDVTLIDAARQQADIAIVILGRNAGGEECDRRLENDYLLHETEQKLMIAVCSRFQQVVLIVNSNGVMDLSWTKEYAAIRSILFIGIPGEAGAEALAHILTGKVCPSGKTAMTWARRYEDYPSAEHFSFNKENPELLLDYASYGLDAAKNGSLGFVKSPVTLYQEGIFMGYRGFESAKMAPLFPFGFGLSYTQFQLDVCQCSKSAEGIHLTARITNTGEAAGREVVQVYASAYGCESQHAPQTLAAFEKTTLLQPGQTQKAELLVPWRSFACYREDDAAWYIERGFYVLKVGNASVETVPVVCIDVPEAILVEQCRNLLGLQSCNRDRLRFQHGEKLEQTCIPLCEWQFTLEKEEIIPHLLGKALKTEISDLVRRMSNEELAALCVGYGPGTPFSAFGDGSDPETIYDAQGKPITCNSHPTGLNGYISPAMPEKGIWSMSYRDGPAGVGGIAWPTAMIMACSFDRKLWYAFGDAVGAECEDFGVDVWLAPAVNLQRHPLCGRNFEYYSEDPLLTGECACAITRGVQEMHPVKVCPKHFAANEQETFRRGSGRKNYDAADSIVQERALRELYLRPFEMLVRQVGVSCIMTSFNKINGVFAGGNHDLCTRLLRDEWRFEGVVVTDWGDMDVVVDGADAVAAGNDVIMPGGPPVIKQILNGLQEGRVSRIDLEKAVAHLLMTLPDAPHLA